jgi:hypothetical protein
VGAIFIPVLLTPPVQFIWIMFLRIGFGSNRLKKRKSQAGKGGKQIFHPSLQLRDTPRLCGYIPDRY